MDQREAAVVGQQVADPRSILEPSAPGHDHITWESARGARVRTADGRELIDFTSGIFVANTGHCHPRVVAAIQEQAARLLNCYDAPHPHRGQVVDRLARLAGPTFDAVALLTGGAEAIEVAVKAAKAFTGRYETLSFSWAFHGKSLATMSLSGLPGNRRGIGPMMPGSMVAMFPTCYRCPLSLTYPQCEVACFDASQRVFESNTTGSLAAVVVEAYLGAGGAYVAPPEFWPRVREFADRHGAVLILDEIQTAFGRSGSMFAFSQFGIVPDVVVVAKGMASGLAMSAVISRREILQSLPASAFSSTYSGNPLACAACLATIDVLEDEDLPGRAAVLGRYALERMSHWVGAIQGVGDVRGIGLAFGIELVHADGTPDPIRALEVLYAAEREGVVTLPPAGAAGNVLRLGPPLVISEADLDAGLDALERALHSTVRVA
jgi:4-aminobutyrate aminotransferase-like enzyme